MKFGNIAVRCKRSLFYMVQYLNIALIIISVLLIVSVADAGSVFTARRGVERTLFLATIVLSVLFFALVIALLLAQ